MRLSSTGIQHSDWLFSVDKESRGRLGGGMIGTLVTQAFSSELILISEYLHCNL